MSHQRTSVTRDEAWGWIQALNERLPGGLNRIDSERLAYTVATESDRIRAAVVKALRDAAWSLRSRSDFYTDAHALVVEQHADDIEAGGDW